MDRSQTPCLIRGIVYVLTLSLALPQPAEYYMDRHCGSTLQLYEGSLLLSLTESPNYAAYMACEAEIESGEVSMDRVMAKVIWIDVEDDPQCEYDRLVIYDNTSSKVQLTGPHGLCGNVTTGIIYKSNGTRIKLKFTSDNSGQHRGFLLLITGFHDGGYCKSSEFRCSQGCCIDTHLKCDGYDNCGDNSDESFCILSEGGIVGISMVGAYIMFAVVILMAYGRKRKGHMYDSV